MKWEDDGYYIKFDRFDSRNHKMIFSNETTYPSSSSDVAYVQALGLDGDIGVDNDRENAFDWDLEFYLADETNIEKQARVLTRNLKQIHGIHNLYCSWDKDYFYQSWLNTEINVSEELKNFGKVILTFHVQPFKIAILGTYPIEIKNGDHVARHYTSTSYPLIHVVGTGDITVNINEQKLILTDIKDEVFVDSMYSVTYDKNKQNLGTHNHTFPFPVLTEYNEISWTGNVTKVELTARWCEPC